MKRFARLVPAVLILCVILAACPGAAEQIEGTNNIQYWYDNAVFYEVSSLPEYLQPYSLISSFWMFGKSNPNSNESDIMESTEKINVVPDSGDQELAGIITDSDYPESVFIDGSNAVHSGDVTYSVHSESKRLRADDTVRVHVLPYEKLPLFTAEPEPIVIEAEVGQVLTAKEVLNQYLPFAEGVTATITSYFSRTPADDSESAGEPEAGLEFNGREDITVRANGIYHLRVNADCFSVGGQFAYATLAVPLRLVCLHYSLIGPKEVMPGESAQYQLSDPGKKVSWSVEGSGASVDENGLLTADEGAPLSTVRVIARLEEEDAEAAMDVVIGSRIFLDLVGSETTCEGGFICPVLKGDSPNPGTSSVLSWNSVPFENPSYDYALLHAYLENCYDLDMTFNIANNETPADSAEAERAYLEKLRPGAEQMVKLLNSAQHLKSGIEEINGHSVLLMTYSSTNYFNPDLKTIQGTLIIPRNWLSLWITFDTSPENTMITDLTDVMRAYAALIRYDEAFDADVKRAGIYLGNREPLYVTSGKTLGIQVLADDPDAMEAFVKRPDFEIVASVQDPNTGEESKLAKTGGLGIRAEKGITSPVRQQLIVYLMPFGNRLTADFTILPPASSVTAEPAKLTLYAGSGLPETVSAAVLPESVPADALAWSASKKDIVELTDNGDGTASVKGLKAGSETLTVQEPGGKKATVKISVVAPVESVDLSVKGKAVPGGTVTVKETLAPKNAGNKAVEWSLDVDESIATVNKGKVKIAKTAPAGTVITVTCTALGAPEPVSRSVTITVE